MKKDEANGSFLPGWDPCFEWLSVLRRCCFGDRKGARPLKYWRLNISRGCLAEQMEKQVL